MRTLVWRLWCYGDSSPEPTFRRDLGNSRSRSGFSWFEVSAVSEKPMETSMLSIRPATVDDVPLLRRLIQELAEYEREPHAVRFTEAELRRDGFGPDPRFRAILAEHDGQPAGYALFFPSYSSWTGCGLFLEDLFVREPFRGQGVGKALLSQVAEVARRESCPTIRMDVLDWNESAIQFYKSIGAEYLPQWRNVVIGTEAVVLLARG